MKLSESIRHFRTMRNLTQEQLANAISISPQAISKWERGESVPDLYVLKQLADFYNVKIDTLIAPPKAVVLQAAHIISKRRITICLSSIGLVWLVATLCFTTIQLIFPSLQETWLSFFYALPITFIILLIFTAVWKNVWVNTLAISLLVWSTILCLFLTLTVLLPSPPTNLWMLFLVGIPAQILVLLFFTYRKLKR